MLPFQIAAGSVVGRDHVHLSKNNQDAYATFDGPHAKVAVVCDGCGSGQFSEVGARMGAQVMVTSIKDWMESFGGPDLSGDLLSACLHYAQKDTLRMVANSVQALTGGLNTLRQGVIDNYFLFTVVGAVITPKVTAIFYLGDGLYALNDYGTVVLEARAGNAPVYMAYNLTETSLKEREPEALKLKIRIVPTDEVDTLILGTDGAQRINERQSDLVPGGTDYVCSINQFAQPEMLKNPDNIRRRLAILNKSGQKVNWNGRTVEKYNGILNDDTTLAVFRRVPSVIETDHVISGGEHDVVKDAIAEVIGLTQD